MAVNKTKHTEEESHDTQQLIVFRQGEEEYGIHIDQIKEVVLTPNITKMPQTPDYVKGVANIRGNIIAIINLEEKFGLEKTTTTEEANLASNYTLVIESEEFKAGILVSEVPNTLTVNTSIIEQSVNIVQDNNVDGGYIQGIVKLDDRLIILIDVFKVLNEKELDKAVADEISN
ncbi:MAG: chemotaxis protein CheW [Bacteroidota bacterium]